MPKKQNKKPVKQDQPKIKEKTPLQLFKEKFPKKPEKAENKLYTFLSPESIDSLVKEQRCFNDKHASLISIDEITKSEEEAVSLRNNLSSKDVVISEKDKEIYKLNEDIKALLELKDKMKVESDGLNHRIKKIEASYEALKEKSDKRIEELQEVLEEERKAKVSKCLDKRHSFFKNSSHVLTTHAGFLSFLGYKKYIAPESGTIFIVGEKIAVDYFREAIASLSVTVSDSLLDLKHGLKTLKSNLENIKDDIKKVETDSEEDPVK